MPKFLFFAFAAMMPAIAPSVQAASPYATDKQAADAEIAMSICQLPMVKSSVAQRIHEWKDSYVPSFAARIKDARGFPALTNVRLGINPQNMALAWMEDGRWQSVFCVADYKTEFYINAFPPTFVPFVIKDMAYTVTMLKSGDQMSFEMDLPAGQLESAEETNSSMWNRMSINGLSIRELSSPAPDPLKTGDAPSKQDAGTQFQAELDAFMEGNGLAEDPNAKPKDAETVALEEAMHRAWQRFSSAKNRYFNRYKSSGVQEANELESKAKLTCGQNDLMLDRRVYRRCMIDNYDRIADYLDSH